MSGTALNTWAVTEEPMKNTIPLAERLNCPISSSSGIKDCIKEKSTEEIYAVDPSNVNFNKFARSNITSCINYFRLRQSHFPTHHTCQQLKGKVVPMLSLQNRPEAFMKMENSPKFL